MYKEKDLIFIAHQLAEINDKQGVVVAEKAFSDFLERKKQIGAALSFLEVTTVKIHFNFILQGGNYGAGFTIPETPTNSNILPLTEREQRESSCTFSIVADSKKTKQGNHFMNSFGFWRRSYGAGWRSGMAPAKWQYNSDDDTKTIIQPVNPFNKRRHFIMAWLWDQGCHAGQYQRICCPPRYKAAA